MFSQITRLTRQTPLAVALLVAAGTTSVASAQVAWNNDSGFWGSASNWNPAIVPGPAHDVVIGAGLGGLYGTVSLNQDSTVDSLSISDGMRLVTLDDTLTVLGHTSVSGGILIPGQYRSSRLRISGGVKGTSFFTNTLSIADRSQVVFEGGIAEIGHTLNIGESTQVEGVGIVRFTGAGTTLVNNGRIEPGNSFGLIFQQFGGGSYDLDGTSGEGLVDLRGYNAASDQGASLRLDGERLSDSFSGQISMGGRSRLDMNLSEGWTVDSNGSFLVLTENGVAAPSRITGGALDFAGRMYLLGNGASVANANLDIESSQIRFRATSQTFVNSENTLNLGGPSTSLIRVDGGYFSVGNDSQILFDAPTELYGATISTSSGTATGGSVTFLRQTNYRGDVTINGFARQNGDAAALNPTVINAVTFDMDGYSGTTTWNVLNTLVVNAERLDEGNAWFDGTFNIDTGFNGRLTINLQDAADPWWMRGTMNLAGSGGLPVTRVAGSRMVVTGDLNVTSGIAQITADTSFSSGDGANVSIPGGATLRMRGATRVGANTTFVGAGTFQNGVGGDMVLNSGVTLSQVGLINNGTLRIAADAPGIASVFGFISTADANWTVDIGGLAAGTQHDTLLVSGSGAMLGGTLDVSLIGLGGGPTFTPAIGDEFTILFALGGVSGTFINDPVSFAGGLTYDWTIIYNPNTVVLRLDSIVPTSGGAALLGLGGLVASRRRRAGRTG